MAQNRFDSDAARSITGAGRVLGQSRKQELLTTMKTAWQWVKENEEIFVARELSKLKVMIPILESIQTEAFIEGKRSSMSRIIIETSEHQDPNGRTYIQFTPVLIPDIYAIGKLAFACWQRWKDEPETHALARQDAIANARKVLTEISESTMY